MHNDLTLANVLLLDTRGAGAPRSWTYKGIEIPNEGVQVRIADPAFARQYTPDSAANRLLTVWPALQSIAVKLNLQDDFATGLDVNTILGELFSNFRVPSQYYAVLRDFLELDPNYVILENEPLQPEDKK